MSEGKVKHEVKQKRIDEEKFMAMRKSVLSLWPTGKEVDLEEAVEYQKSMPDNKNFCKVIQKLREEGRTVVFPRAGTPLVEDEIELVQTLYEAGVPLLPCTTDSYTRHLQFEKVEQALEESKKSGRAMLNGYPIINHGVKNTRKVVESCGAAFNPRTSRLSNSLVGEIAFASGMTAQPTSFFPWFGSYDKTATLEECIGTSQYLSRLMGWYADQGVIITSDLHGWLPNGVFPISINVATIIIEGLVAAEQGVKSVLPLVECQGHLAQDIAAIRVTPKLLRRYLDRFGYNDVIIPGTSAQQVPLFAFPRDRGGAFGYVTYTCFVGALGEAEIVSPRSIDEGIGVPTKDAHVETYKAANWINQVVRTQKIKMDNEEIETESKVLETEVTAILEAVLKLGNGDIVIGAIKAVDAGVLDSPFPLNIHAKDNVLGVRDSRGACRYVEFGSLPIPEEIKEFHRAKVAEREKKENRKMDYYAAIDDFWAISKGQLLGKPRK
ncbi:MAG: methylaspartate mutase subunit E [Bacillota bacterium]|nr:methylaspartate mutase subunit E [Bacillota bacterium]